MNRCQRKASSLGLGQFTNLNKFSTLRFDPPVAQVIEQVAQKVEGRPFDSRMNVCVIVEVSLAVGEGMCKWKDTKKALYECHLNPATKKS